MNRLLIKRRLLETDQHLIDLSRSTGVPYDRLVRIVNGYRLPKTDEIELIARALNLPFHSVAGQSADACDDS